MNNYTEFCRLRDYRMPGVEVCKYTESEAFALATCETAEFAAVHALISDDQYAATFQSLGQYRNSIKKLITQRTETHKSK